MLLKEYKENLKFKDIEKWHINKYVNIRGKEVLILNLVKYNCECKLWIVHKNTFNKEEDNGFEFSTNRDDLVTTIKNNTLHINFRKLKLDDIEINFESSSSSTVEYAHGDDLIMINYFIEKGYLDETWDDVNIEDIIFSCYLQNKDEDLPTINTNKNTRVTLELQEEFIEYLIQQPIKATIDKFEKDNKVHYKDYNGKEDYFYLNEIGKYDLWNDTIEKIENNIKNIEPEYQDEYKEDMMNSVKNTCPKNMDYTIIHYENKDNIQLRFLSKEYLDKKPEYGSSSTAMYWISENKIGINGYYQYTDGLLPVEKNFNGEIEFELFSKFIQLPKENIEFTLE